MGYIFGYLSTSSVIMISLHFCSAKKLLSCFIALLNKNLILKLNRFLSKLLQLFFCFCRFVPLTFILPAVTAALVQFVFGSDLHDLKFGYVINDEPFNSTAFANETLNKANCFNSKFSHLFLSKISSDALILVSMLVIIYLFVKTLYYNIFV